MKKRVLAFLCVIMLCMMNLMTVFASDTHPSRVVDDASLLSSSQQAIQNNTSENCRSIRIANTNYEIRREYLDNKEYKFVIFMDAIPCYEAFENDKSFSLIFITIDKKSYENKVIENDFESNVCRYKNYVK